MPQKNSRLDKRRAPIRRCAQCNRIGHNARTCDQGKAIPVSPISDLPKKQKKTRTQGTISISVIPTSPPVSRHVVSLKNEELDRAWKNIHVYRPAQQREEVRVPVDFVRLVRDANNNEFTARDEKESLKKPSVDILKEIARIEGGNDIPVDFTTYTAYKNSKNEEKTSLVNFSEIKDKRPRRKVSVLLQEHITQIKDRAKNTIHIKKFALTFTILCVIATLPFPVAGFYRKVEDNTSKIVAESTHAFLSLQSSTLAAFKQNIPQAEADLNQALNSFGAASTLVDKEYKALVYVLDLLPIIGTKIKSRQQLLEAGHYLALGNAYLIKGIGEAGVQNDSSTIERLVTLRTHIRGALPQYTEALKRLDEVEPSSLPVEYQESFGEFRGLFHTLVSDIHNISDVISGLELMLGSDGFKRYLVVFQNQYELRPTGGFIGSFGVIDVQNGKILNIEVPGGGSYDLQGQLSAYVTPPLPLQLINTRWEFQDANWFPDFKSTGEKLAWFYQKSRNTTVDGVIAINASVLERVLRVIGPIQNDQYNVLLTSESAIKNLSYEIESYTNEDGKNTPKAVLSVLLEQITEVMKHIEPDQLISMVTELSGALHEREIQTYFTDTRLQSLVRSYGWTGEIIKTSENQDYLMVVNANIGGGKSDENMSQFIEHQAVVEDDGSIVDTVVITRSHAGDEDENTLLGQLNSSYIRVYVPKGSELLDAGGFVYPDESSFKVSPSWYKEDTELSSVEKEEGIHPGSGTRIVKEFGKTSFGNWVVTYPKSMTQVYFKYRLPFKVFGSGVEKHDGDTQGLLGTYANKVASFTSEYREPTSRYSIVIQKQSGIQSEFEHTIIYGDQWKPVWKTNEDLSLSLNGGQVRGILESDKVFGIIMKKQ